METFHGGVIASMSIGWRPEDDWWPKKKKRPDLKESADYFSIKPVHRPDPLVSSSNLTLCMVV